MNECGYIQIKLYLWTLKFKFHKNVICPLQIILLLIIFLIVNKFKKQFLKKRPYKNMWHTQTTDSCSRCFLKSLQLPRILRMPLQNKTLQKKLLPPPSKIPIHKQKVSTEFPSSSTSFPFTYQILTSLGAYQQQGLFSRKHRNSSENFYVCLGNFCEVSLMLFLFQ